MCHWVLCHENTQLTIRRKAAGSRPNLCPSAYVITLHGISIAVWSELTTFAGAGATGTGCPKTPLQPSPQDLDMAQANFDFLTAHNQMIVGRNDLGFGISNQ